MLLLEWSDTLVRFKVLERQNWVLNNIDFDDYDTIQLIIKFADERVLYVVWEPEEIVTYSIVGFSIYSEQTKWKAWNFVADIWGIKNWSKKLRFNKKTIKWKVLPSVKVPKWVTNAEQL